MKKYWWIILIVLAAVFYFVWKAKQQKKAAPKVPVQPLMAPVKPVKSEPVKSDSIFPLKRGSRGEEVRLLQKSLNSKFGAMLTPHGNFDEATEAALARAGFKKEVDEMDFKLIQTASIAMARKLKNQKK